MDRLHLTKKTTIVFLSDHGYHAGEHGQFGKWTNFELGTRVPLIVSSPGVTTPGTESTSIVELVDIYPTLLELNGISLPKAPDKLDGVSFLSILKNPEEKNKTLCSFANYETIECKYGF